MRLSRNTRLYLKKHPSSQNIHTQNIYKKNTAIGNFFGNFSHNFMKSWQFTLKKKKLNFSSQKIKNY
jgi:hypothetical protein